jgi:hypothetical protein
MRAVRWILVAAALLAGGTARAGDNDLVLARLGSVVVDDSGRPVDAVGNSGDFRSLASELGVVLAPRLTQPADTLGFGGFQFTADVALTRVHTDRPYWRALASSPDPSDPAASHGDDIMTTVGVFARKGIWLPAPSFEIGIGAVHLAASEMWAAQMYAKLALIEGYHDLPIPSLALRAGASRMMGSDQLDLTVASFDLSVSKEIGVGGTFNLSPYLGWDWLLIVPRSEVIDKTPNIDSVAEPTDSAMDFIFVEQDDIIRTRLFGGVLLRYYVFTLGLEGALAFAGSSKDDATDAVDASGSQASFTVTAGFDF